MTKGAVVTRNETTNRRPGRWEVRWPHEDKFFTAEHRAKDLLFWVNDTIGKQPTQPYQASPTAEQLHSTVENDKAKEGLFSGRILCRPMTVPVDHPAEVSDVGVELSSSDLEKLATQSLLGSWRDAVTIRTSDGGAMAITREMADLHPTYLPSEPEVHAEASFLPLWRSLTGTLAGVRPRTAPYAGL